MSAGASLRLGLSRQPTGGSRWLALLILALVFLAGAAQSRGLAVRNVGALPQEQEQEQRGKEETSWWENSLHIPKKVFFSTTGTRAVDFASDELTATDLDYAKDVVLAVMDKHSRKLMTRVTVKDTTAAAVKLRVSVLTKSDRREKMKGFEEPRAWIYSSLDPDDADTWKPGTALVRAAVQRLAEDISGVTGEPAKMRLRRDRRHISMWEDRLENGGFDEYVTYDDHPLNKQTVAQDEPEQEKEEEPQEKEEEPAAGNAS